MIASNPIPSGEGDMISALVMREGRGRAGVMLCGQAADINLFPIARFTPPASALAAKRASVPRLCHTVLIHSHRDGKAGKHAWALIRRKPRSRSN